MKLINSTYNPLLYIYLIFMSLIYAGYVWLAIHRMTMSEVWRAKSTLTTEDVAMIGQHGTWSERLEISFSLLFVGMVVFCLWKRRRDLNVGRNFVMVNIFLSIGIVVFSLIFNPFIAYTFMDLVLPLFNLVIIAVWLSIFLIIERLIKNRNIVSRF